MGGRRKILTTFYADIAKPSPLEVPVQNTTDSQSLQETRSDKSKTKISDKTIEELVKQQADTVKKIVADQKQQTRPDYPIVTRLDPQYKDEVKKEVDTLSLEELKIKCQHLSKLFAENKTSDGIKAGDQNLIPASATRRVNNKPQDLHKRPVYVQQKTTVKPTTTTTTTQKPTGFYITSHSSTTQKPIVTEAPIKFIRLEPVILQKTVLNDGRIVYYWHRSLPTAVQFATDASQNKYQTQADYYTPYHNYVPPVHSNFGNTPPYGYPVLPQNSYIPGIPNSYIPPYPNTYSSTQNSIGEAIVSTESTTQMSTTSTTEESSYSGYGLGSFLPFYSSRRQDSTTTTTTEPTTTTTTTTTPKPSTETPKTDDLPYAQQLRFVIPVPYGNNGAVRRPWDFDQYAYYPKELQPKTVNVQVPYTPTFHMITAVAVPNSEGNLNDKAQHLAN